MAKHRPHGPKGHSSGRPKSGQRSLSGARPGGPKSRRRPGGGPGSRPRPAGGPHGPRPERSGARPAAGPERRDRAGAPEPRPRANLEPGHPERLQKILAQAGLGSRRGCEELIIQGRVTVDGQVVRELGTKVDPAARIAVDGEPIRLEPLVYYAVNKPEGYVSTNLDPSGRPRVIDLVPDIPERVYTVGRLDEDSTGLMILTNDGELANRLAHPRFGVEKLYQALVAGLPTPESLAKLTEGVWLSDGKVRAKRVRIAGRRGQATLLELVLAEGKKREIRRMLAKLGHKVMSLNRIAIGPITLKGLPVGESRQLTRHEVELLRRVASGVALSVPGFADDGPSRAHRGKGPAPRGGPAARGRKQDQQPDRRREQGHDKGPARGPARRAGAGRPMGPAGTAGHPPRHRPADAEAAPPVRGPAGPPGAGGPKHGPRGPKHGAHGPQAGPRGPKHGAGPQAEARGPKRPAGPGPQAERPPARTVQGPGPRHDEESPPRRRIIGLEGPAAAAPGGRKRPPARKPRPPRSALGPRPGRMRPPRPKSDQDDEQ